MAESDAASNAATETPIDAEAAAATANSTEEPPPAAESDAPAEDAAEAPASELPASDDTQAAAASGGGDHKRKLEETAATEDSGAPAAAAGEEADGEDAKRQRVDGEADGLGLEQISEPGKTEAAAASNGELPPTEGSQPSSMENPPDSVTEEPQQDGLSVMQQDGDISGATEEISRKIEVPNNKVGVLIGKAGDTIKFLQINSGAKIQITRDAEADPNSSTRPVELIGPVGSVDKAEQLIRNVIAEADAGGSPALIARGFGSVQSGAEQFEMQVPNEKVGLIIGKGGETIKNLQTRSGARIQLIPQHPPEGVTPAERTVRVTGNKKQIEAAKEFIKQAMNQTLPRQTAQSGGYGQQAYRPSGPQWGPRSQPLSQPPTGYGYQQRGMPPPQNMPYPQTYGNYSQQPPPRGGMGTSWDQRQGAPFQSSQQSGGYDYYRQGPQPFENQPSNMAPGPGAPTGNYNSYGQSQAPGYGQPTQYPPSGPAQQNYGHGYGAQAPNQQFYGQPPMGSQPGYSQQPDPYGKPGYGVQQPYGPPRAAPPGDGMYQAAPPSSYGPGAPNQQPYPYNSSAPPQQAPAYGQTYGQAAGPDGYAQPAQPGYSQPGGQVPAAYSQGAPAGANYAQQGTQQGGYAQYPPTQPVYGDQAAPNNMNYGYQGGPADPNYGNSYPQSGYSSAPASGQAGYGQAAGYTQPPTNPTGYEQAMQQPQSGYAGAPGNPQAGYAKGVSPQPGYGGQWTA